MSVNTSLVEQRQDRIMDYLREHKEAKTVDLSTHLNVSEVTIRRDVKDFEQYNFIERFHGGIRLIGDITDQEVLYEEKGSQFNKVKQMIAKKAVSFIEDGDTVFVNSGSTTLSVIQELNRSGKSIRIITNNAMAPTVIDNHSVELLMTGGEYRLKSKSLIGDNAIRMISKIAANKCIIGVNGISAEEGISTSVYQETSINEMMVESCFGEVIVVADSSKIEEFYNFKSANIDQIDKLITDQAVEDLKVRNIQNKGVQVVISEIEEDSE